MINANFLTVNGESKQLKVYRPLYFKVVLYNRFWCFIVFYNDDEYNEIQQLAKTQLSVTELYSSENFIVGTPIDGNKLKEIVTIFNQDHSIWDMSFPRILSKHKEFDNLVFFTPYKFCTISQCHAQQNGLYMFFTKELHWERFMSVHVTMNNNLLLTHYWGLYYKDKMFIPTTGFEDMQYYVVENGRYKTSVINGVDYNICATLLYTNN